MPNPDNSPRGRSDGEDLEQLTRQAVDAAVRGDWAAVQRCYRRRGERLAQDVATVNEAAALLALDAVVTERLALVRTAIQRLLADATLARRQSQALAASTMNRRRLGIQIDHLT